MSAGAESAFTQPTLAAPELARRLADWFRAGHRPMPWRETRDPYRLWLSEVMLQQTQVETVRAYYERFVSRWPTVQALAAATDSEVMKAWEGLGYYARARNLLATARAVAAFGAFPDSLAGMSGLPGVGRSTAGAILTFAFGQRHPSLDGNVKRVLSRLHDVGVALAGAAVERELWAASAALLDGADDPWTHNQALMELGARVCTPRRPACETCPLREGCAAQLAGTTAQRPVRVRRPPLPHKHIGVGVLHCDGRVYIQLRPPEGLLGGLWEFPGGKQEPGEPIEHTVTRELREELGVTAVLGEALPEVRHAYTHFRVTLHPYLCTLSDPSDRERIIPRAAVEARWVPRAALGSYAFPKANRRILDALPNVAVLAEPLDE